MNSNLTAVFHKEKIPDTQILSSFCGKFIPILACSRYDPINGDNVDQICLQYSSKIKIYGIKKVIREKNENNEGVNTLYLLNTYEIFDRIEYSEKFNSLLNNKSINSIILSLSSFKISIIEYNLQFDTFNTLALYSIDDFFLGGKLNAEKSFRIVSSLTYNYIAFIYDENKMSILRKKKDDKKSEYIENHCYSDTLNGDKYFLPTIYLNDLNNKYNIYSIINIYIPKKNFEFFYHEKVENNQKSKKEIDIIKIYILFIESRAENNELNNTINDENIENNTITNGESENQMNFNSYMREKVSLGLLSYNCKTNEYIDFQILFNGIDENAFDFTILENESNNINDNLAIIFSAYNLQIINLKSKTSKNFIMSNYYNSIFSKLYPDLSKYEICQINDYLNGDTNLDLRGGGFLVIADRCLIFSDSKGKLIYITINENDEVYFQNIQIDNENNCLNSPYNRILMPYTFIFFLSSPFSDAVIFTYNKDKENFQITDRIINYSPIINFHLVNDMNNNDLILVFTSGYGKNSSLSFAYEKFLFNIFPKNMPEIYDIDYMKSINYIENEYTKFILCKLKNRKLLVFQNANKDLINISKNINYNKENNIIEFGEIKINGNINQKLIVLIFDKGIKLYDNNFNLFTSNNTDNFLNFEINKAKVGENSILIYNVIEKKYFILGVYDSKIESNSNDGIMEMMINQNIYLRYKELTEYLDIKNNELIEINMISKLYLNKFNFLMIYRNNLTIQIYDITQFLNNKRNDSSHSNNRNKKKDNDDNFRLLLKSNYINYSPPLLLKDDTNILYRSNSNLNIDFSNSLNNLFNINNIFNLNNNLSLRNSASFTIDSPNFVYFDNIGNICILAITFKSMLILYTLYISKMSDDKEEIKEIGFKKKIIEKLENIDFKEFCRINLNNLFIPFNNIDKKAGILFNLENNRRIIYEVNNELCLLKINNEINKTNFSSFCNYNNEDINDGFIIFEGGLFKFCKINNNYNLSNYSLLIKTNKINRFPVLLTYTPEYAPINYTFTYSYYNYILIEKEMIASNRFQYYMTLRREDKKEPINEIKFKENETVTECNVIELPIILGNNNTKKYIAVGINTIDEKQGEDNNINSKINLYNKDNGILELVTEKDGFRGIITMIESLYSLILVGEGSRINVYQFIPGQEYLMNKLIYIENKNLTLCNRIINKALLLTGDIVDSFNFMYMKHSNINNNMNKQIDLIVESKDNNHIKITTCNLWTIKGKKCCILFDEENNGYIYYLADGNISRICDFCANRNINEIRPKIFKNKNNEYYSYYYSSLNGSIGFINHIENEIYEKLNYLCEFIYYHFPFNCGVNPKIFYSLKYENDINNNSQKPKGRFIDFNILDIFLKLSDKMQDIICRKVFGIDDKNIIINYIYDLID